VIEMQGKSLWRRPDKKFYEPQAWGCLRQTEARYFQCQFELVVYYKQEKQFASWRAG
jgi:hypothetical protein